MLGKEATNLTRAVNSQAVAWIEFITRLILWIFDCIAVNVFTLIRSHFGERFMSVVNYIFGSMIFGTLMLLVAFAGSPQTLLWRAVWGPAVFLTFVFHRWVIRKKNRTGIEWYSYSDGIPHLLRIPIVARYVPVEVVEKWLEPAAVLVVSWIVRPFDRGFSFILAFIAVSLCIRAYVGYYMERQRYLDLRDERIIATYTVAALQGKDAHETAGFTIAKSNRQLIQQEEAIAQAARDLPDEVQQMLDSVLHVAPQPRATA